jgi:LacI family transcriptional regulator
MRQAGIEMRHPQRAPAEPATVALVASLGLAHCRRILRGIAAAAPAQAWRLAVLAPAPDLRRALRALRPDGIIIHVPSQAVGRLVAGLGIPAVNVSGLVDGIALPRVGVDDEAIGRLAARHLRDLALGSFAVVVDAGHAAARRRELAFRAELGAAGHAVRVLRLRRCDGVPDAGRMLLDPAAGRWLAALPRPCGIFAYHDALAFQVVEALCRSGRTVPDDAAVLGVDDDDLVCALARPPLSSVALPSEQVGARAAAVLDGLLRGARAPAAPLLLPPVRVVARQSTDPVAGGDAAVAAFLAHLRAGGAAAAIGPAVRAAGVSRRTLERRLRVAIGRGPAQELRRRRFARAQQLLAGGDLPLAEVARRAGFADAKRLALVFRRLAGTTPSAWRRASRG